MGLKSSFKKIGGAALGFGSLGMLGSGGALGGLGGLAGGLTGVLGGFVNEYFDRRAMNYQNELQRQNWEMQNAYNTPSAQMARYKEAGLNPNLIYGQSNTAGAIASPSATSKGVDPLAYALGGVQIKQMRADVANKQAQNSLLNSQADYVKEQVVGQALDNAIKRQTLKSVGQGNPNDPYWYRDIKKHPLLGNLADGLGRFVGSMSLSPQYTVRVNGKEFVGLSEQMAQDILNRELSYTRKKGGRR